MNAGAKLTKQKSCFHSLVDQKKGKRFVEQSQEKDNNAKFNSPWVGKVHQNTSKQQSVSFSLCGMPQGGKHLIATEKKQKHSWLLLLQGVLL